MIQDLNNPPKKKVVEQVEDKEFSPLKLLSEFLTAKTLSIFRALPPDGTKEADRLLQKKIYKRFRMACD